MGCSCFAFYDARRAAGVPVTRATAQVLDFVREQCDAGCSPTLREIAEHFGWKSTNAPRVHLWALYDAGHLTRDERRKARPWRVVRV